MIYIIAHFVIAISIAFAQTSTNEFVTHYEYVEFNDVRDNSNEFENLRITYELCSQINSNANSIAQCQFHAYERAISIDA